MDVFERIFITCFSFCMVVGFVVGYLFPNNIIAYALTAIPAGLVVKVIVKKILKEGDRV